MFVTILLITLSFSFCLQIFVIVQYLASKGMTYYKIFLGTFVINTILMVVVSVFAFRDPASIYRVNMKFILWMLSGFITIIIIFIQIGTLIKIYLRAKDPVNYTINFFGRKVYEQGILRKHEFAMFVITMPIFLFAGSYFIARLINILLGHI